MTEMTVVYYTANREPESFERKIQDTILANMGDSDLISVSQKPIAFGTNICVGEVGVTGHNAWRQFQIGVEKARTKYVCVGEADGLYPPDYFAFRPPRADTFYVAAPLYVLFAQRGRMKRFHPKASSEAAMIVSRDMACRWLERMYRGLPQWNTADDFIWLLRHCTKDTATLNCPVVTIKTDHNMHRKTPHSVHHYEMSLPYWGSASDVLARYC